MTMPSGNLCAFGSRSTRSLAALVGLAALAVGLGFANPDDQPTRTTPARPGADAPAQKAPPPPAEPTAPKAPEGGPGGDVAPAAPPIPIAGTMWDQLYKDLDGKPRDLAEFAGKPMVIELWATWCGPCRKQREHMHQMSAEFPDITFIAASTDATGGNAVRIFLAEKKSPKTSRVVELLATPELQAKLNTINNSNSIPKVAYVSSRGKLLDVSIGTQNPVFMRNMLKNMTKPAKK